MGAGAICIGRVLARVDSRCASTDNRSKSKTHVDKKYVLTYASEVKLTQLENSLITPITASDARADLYRLIDQTAESHQPILIAGKRSSAVLVAAEDWQAIQETLYLLSVPGMRESIKAGMAEPLGKSAKAVVW